MLSILIPIYNYNVYPLVLELHKQCLECEIKFEIVCQDDASGSDLNFENEKINLLSNSSFITLKENIAHRKNRNLLAEKAKYNYLLFIDGDSNVISSNYVSNYIQNIQDFDIVYGGRIHPEVCPSDLQKLRWKYGKLIEDKTCENRKKTPFQSLLFNNTIIKKECFNKIKFDLFLIKYGHDDTQLSYQLSLLEAKVNHINNPVEHGDIDNNSFFVAKMKGSLENLIYLYEEKKITQNFSKLISLLLLLNKLKLTYFVSKFYLLLEKVIFKQLEGNNPNLFVFNLFRIGYLCVLESNKTKN
jgi:hypothetical protein